MVEPSDDITAEKITPPGVISYAFARRPRWIALHMLVFLVVCLFAVAGFWQLRRLEERRADNALVQQRRARPPVTGIDGAEPHRRARLDGVYDTSHDVLLLGRGGDGRPGDHVLTPLRTRDGTILVDRGWIPHGTPTTRSRPVSDAVTVDGLLLPSESRGPFSASADGPVETISRIDLQRISAASPYPIERSVYVLLAEQHPPQELPRPVDPAELDEGSHRIYAVQWFCFIPIALVVYVALMRQHARKAGWAELAYDAAHG